MNQETKRKRGEKIIENDILERPINGRGMKGRKKGRKIGPVVEESRCVWINTDSVYP